MNLHLAQEEKFIDGFIENVKKYGDINENVFIIYKRKKSTGSKFLNSKEAKYVEYNSPGFDDVKNSLNSYDKIFLHGLSYEMSELLANTDEHGSLYWIFYGYEVYDFNFFAQDIYGPESLKYFYKSKSKFLPGKAVDFFLKNKYRRIENCKKTVIQKVDCFLHFNPFDFQQLKRRYQTDAKLVPFFYGASNSIFDDLNANQKNSGWKRPRLLLGNSASIFNNHIEAFAALLPIFQKLQFDITASLAYGDRAYTDYIVNLGKRHFGEYFHPMLSFVPKAEYFDFLKSMDVAFMNHRRSQAVGNLLPLIYMGKKIVLNQDNPLLYFFKSHEILVHQMETSSPEVFLEPLPVSVQQENGYKIKSLFSQEKLISNYTNILNKQL